MSAGSHRFIDNLYHLDSSGSDLDQESRINDPRIGVSFLRNQLPCSTRHCPAKPSPAARCGCFVTARPSSALLSPAVLCRGMGDHGRSIVAACLHKWLSQPRMIVLVPSRYTWLLAPPKLQHALPNLLSAPTSQERYLPMWHLFSCTTACIPSRGSHVPSICTDFASAKP